MKVEMVKTSTVIPFEKNAKKHPEEQVQYIANSLKRFGWQQPLVIDKHNILVVGHGRLMAAKRLKMKEVPVIRAENLTDEEIAAYRLADNKTAESGWDDLLLGESLAEIPNIDMGDFGFDLNLGDDDSNWEWVDDRDPSCQHNVFENQERMQFPIENYYGIPVLAPTQTTGDKMLRFMDWKEIDNPQDYIAHFYYDDYKFMSAWREPDKYIERLKKFKAVITPNFSTYTDFPRALQILACYRSNWCGAFWQSMGIDVIPDVCWGDRESWNFCFEGIPKGGTVCVSSVSVRNDKLFNGKEDTLFKDGFDEMMRRLEPTTVIYYGSMIDGLEGNIIRVPSYYEEKFNGKRKQQAE